MPFASSGRFALARATMSKGPFTLGTRGSPLALAQAHMAAAALEAAHGWARGTVRIYPVKTSGDRIQDRPLADVGGKALWTKELDLALLAGETDASVHSMKDVESERPDALRIAAMLPRADVRDRLIGAASLGDLPDGAIVGTSSPRRDRSGGCSKASEEAPHPSTRTGRERDGDRRNVTRAESGCVPVVRNRACRVERARRGRI